MAIPFGGMTWSDQIGPRFYDRPKRSDRSDRWAQPFCLFEDIDSAVLQPGPCTSSYLWISCYFCYFGEVIYSVVTSSCRGHVDELATEPFLLLYREHGTGYWRSWNCCDRRTCFVVIWKHFFLTLSAGTRIRIGYVMCPRSSSRGRNTSASVTVTITSYGAVSQHCGRIGKCHYLWWCCVHVWWCCVKLNLLESIDLHKY